MRILTPAAFSFFLLIQSTLSILAILTIQPVPALAESAESFKTEEYRESNALDIINAADAYALGYTGLGQTVGVLDTPVRVDHPELAGKRRP